MDSRQAREILSLYRPGIDDAADPFFAEAVAQARREPELARWFERHQGVDAALRQKFKQIPVPTGLEQQIISERKIVRPSIWRERRVLLAAAAAAIVVVVITSRSLRQAEPREFGAFRKTMANLVSGQYKMMLETKDLNAVRQFLATNHGPADYVLTKKMETLPAEGCALIDWHGQRVSLVCLDHGTDNDLFLFVIDRSALTDPPTGQEPLFARIGQMTTVSWTTGDKAYVLAAKGSEDDLRKFL